ncbi:MAG TPA: hypothetical protein VLF91_06605 [Candidatus Saccharimonadales bacterium]|nr:hypothetical protein [Candidatus Saccharimonadales bacterium]
MVANERTFDTTVVTEGGIDFGIVSTTPDHRTLVYGVDPRMQPFAQGLVDLRTRSGAPAHAPATYLAEIQSGEYGGYAGVTLAPSFLDDPEFQPNKPAPLLAVARHCLTDGTVRIDNVAVDRQLRQSGEEADKNLYRIAGLLAFQRALQGAPDTLPVRVLMLHASRIGERALVQAGFLGYTDKLGNRLGFQASSAGRAQTGISKALKRFSLVSA